jgi:hypothetical protein
MKAVGSIHNYVTVYDKLCETESFMETAKAWIGL